CAAWSTTISVTAGTSALDSDDAKYSTNVTCAASPTRNTTRGNTATSSPSIQCTITTGSFTTAPAATSTKIGWDENAAFSRTNASMSVSSVCSTSKSDARLTVTCDSELVS